MEKFLKTPDQIAILMEHWFFHYHGKDRTFFSGAETFTLFELVAAGLQGGILQRVNLNEGEKPVLLLKCDGITFVLNTTHRFIRLGESEIESVAYTDFMGHMGYRSLQVIDEVKGIKTDGYFADFGLKKLNGETIYWSIPTGKPGFASSSGVNIFDR
jgi:hypothetical protein